MIHHSRFFVTLLPDYFFRHDQDMDPIRRGNQHTTTVTGPLNLVQAATRGTIGFDDYSVRARDGFFDSFGKIPNPNAAIARGSGQEGRMGGVPVEMVRSSEGEKHKIVDNNTARTGKQSVTPTTHH